MEHIAKIFEFAAHIVDIFGLTLLVLGFARGAVGWVRLEVQRLSWPERLGSLRKLRCIVGIHIIYALELMIVSDIIESFLATMAFSAHGGSFFSSSAFYALAELAMIVAIRTAIEFFLARELEAMHPPESEPDA